VDSAIHQINPYPVDKIYTNSIQWIIFIWWITLSRLCTAGPTCLLVVILLVLRRHVEQRKPALPAVTLQIINKYKKKIGNLKYLIKRGTLKIQNRKNKPFIMLYNHFWWGFNNILITVMSVLYSIYQRTIFLSFAFPIRFQLYCTTHHLLKKQTNKQTRKINKQKQEKTNKQTNKKNKQAKTRKKPKQTNSVI